MYISGIAPFLCPFQQWQMFSGAELGFGYAREWHQGPSFPAGKHRSCAVTITEVLSGFLKEMKVRTDAVAATWLHIAPCLAKTALLVLRIIWGWSLFHCWVEICF